MHLQLDPLDTLFFRDGRPFSMGDDSYAQGIFPPLPSTVLGALRSHWISLKIGSNQADLDELAGEARKIELHYFGLAFGGEPIFPAPLDLFQEDEQIRPMKLMSKKDLISSCPDEVSHLFFAETSEKTAPVAGDFLETEAMKNYLAGNAQKGLSIKNLNATSLHREFKIGIGRSRETNRTNDGQLFRLLANRMEDGFGEEEALSFLIKLHGFDVALTNHAVLPLGGERRSVAVKSIQSFEIPACPTLNNEYFKIVLLTPAPVGAWYPKDFIAQNGLEFVAAAIGRPVLVGGWDYKEKQPKLMRRAVTAGSVFLFKAKNAKHANDVARQTHGLSICQAFDDREGFGLCLIAQPFENQSL